MTIRTDEYILIDTPYDTGDTILFRGRRQRDGLPIMAKTLKDGYPGARCVAVLRHEFSLMSDLDVPGVVKVLDLTKLRSGLAIIMEDQGGRALSDIIAERRLDLGTILRLAISLAEAVGAVHRRHIIHKDIKPHNILVDAALQRATLFDFGIATRLSHELPPAGAPLALEGTLPYISPEQTGRMNRSVDHRTDLYSLGVTLYEILTGERPFASRDPMELVHSHIAKAPVPPHERAPDVPEVVSDIVMKLLSKAAEDRYQRAEGLAADLARCLEAWEADRRIAPFPLGSQDATDKVQIPQKLYGRWAEVAALMTALERARRGAAELLMVTGGAGVGKSVLVNEVHKGIAQYRGYFIAGKFDIHRDRNTPYAAIAEAFGKLARQFAAEKVETVQRFRDALLQALGANGQVLIEVIPELELVMGPQPSVPEFGPIESQNRFTLAFQNALRVCATARHPLVLFLDDMQWADPASLKLLKSLLTDPGGGHLLILGAYRDDEVSPGHPLALALDELKSLGAASQELSLKPLSMESVRQVVSDALGCGPERAAPLADLVFEKSQGNPFFVRQLLTELGNEKLVEFDPQSRSFAWDLERVRERLHTDDVTVFIAEKIEKFHPSAQRLLALGACIGHEFDLETLATASERPLAEIAAGMWKALSEGLLLPLDADYRLLEASLQADDVAAPPFINARYRFLHDRVRQVAYSFLAEEERRALHLRIGRLLRAKGSSAEARGDELFAVVRHLNLGAELIEDREERLDLARRNLAAGKRARTTTAFAAATEYFTAGVAALQETGFEDDHELAFALHMGQAECAYLSGQRDRSDCIADGLLQRALGVVEQASVHTMRASLYLAGGRLADSLRAALTGAALFGISLPEREEERQAALAEWIGLVESNLGGRSIDELLDAPVLTDPERLVLMRVLISAYSPGFIISPTIAVFVLTEMVNICLKHGHSDLSAFAYGAYGLILAKVYGRYRQGYEFGRLALAINEKFPSPDIACRLYLVTGVPLHFSRPLPSVVEHLRRGYQIGLASGDFFYLSLCAKHILEIRLGHGDDLVSVLEEAERFLALMQRTKEPLPESGIRVSRQFAASLQGRTKNRRSLSDSVFDESSVLASTTARGSRMTAELHVAKLQILFLQEDYAGALEAAAQAQKEASTIAAFFTIAQLVFHHGLTLCAVWATSTDAERDERLRLIEAHRDKLATWAQGCPENFRAKHMLVLAEISRIQGDDLKAMDQYDAALSAAKESGITRDEALANELAAKFYFTRGREKIAQLYMMDAYYGYLRWGAVTKVDAITATYPSLLLEPAQRHVGRDEPRRSVTITGTISRTGKSDGLDLSVVMKAAHAISSEIELHKVIERMMQIIAESAGAQRGVLLLLDRSGQLVVEATITFDPHKVEIGPGARAALDSVVAVSLVEEVARTGRHLVLDDASTDGAWVDRDPYIAARRPRSVMCVAMTHQGRSRGVLYLENNVASAAFTPTRVELSVLLASQAAVAVENALLYERVMRMTEELKRSNELLESTVDRRTEELRALNEQLTVELAQREWADAERAQAEAARAALQEQIIHAQRERLAELSTPIIPITEEVMVMPLIGTMDVARMQQLQETALQGAAASRAQVVILDITGIRAMDASVASALVKTTSALKLLGAKAVITGVRPDVAQELIGINVDLGALVTRGTLRSGIAYALACSRGTHRQNQAVAAPERQGASALTPALHSDWRAARARPG